MHISKALYVLGFVLSIQSTFAQTPQPAKAWNYPTITPDTAIDYYFGKKVIDPYRNLEDSTKHCVKAWMKAQNEFYDTIIGNIIGRDLLNSEMQDMRKKQKKWGSFPRSAGNRIFYPMGFTDDKIERLVYIDSLNVEPVELFSTKEINEKDKSVYSIDYFEPSFDGKYIAFGISPNGNEKATIFIVDVEKKQLLSEIIERSRGGNIQWLPDCSGFFYLRNKEIITEEDKKYPYSDIKVNLHKLHTNSETDKDVFSRLTSKGLNIKPTNWPALYTFPSSGNILGFIMDGHYSAIYYANRKDILTKSPNKVKWKKICSEEEKIYTGVLYGNNFYGLCYKQNSNGQLVMKKLPDLASTVLLDAKGFSLDDIVCTKNNLYVTTIENGISKLIKVNPETFFKEEIKLPYTGSIRVVNYSAIVSNYQHSDFLTFTLSSYNKNRKVYTCDVNNKITATEIISDVQYTAYPLDLVVEETEAISHDGVKVPLSVVYKKGLKLDGTNPTLIEAYGAYGISIKPEFNKNRLIWFNHGGIYAVAHVRGGSEKGDEWYKGGFKATKPNSWKDLIACAEYLINNKYTSPDKLAVRGASAGGITVGRAITERPELFKAAVINVGVLNTIRTELSNGEMYIAEYGTIKDSVEFQYLYEMDTYNHIHHGIKYPSVLFSSGLSDARVIYWQSAKTVAKMQQMDQLGNLILYRVEDKGHFSYPSEADVYSFLFWQLGHPDFKLKTNESMFKVSK